MSELESTVQKLLGRVTALEQAVRQLGGEAPVAMPVEPSDLAAAEEAVQAARAEVEALSAKNVKLLADYERIEGEYQALKLKAQAAPAKQVAPSIAELGTLRFKVAKLTTDHESLQAKHKELEAQHTTLLAQTRGDPAPTDEDSPPAGGQGEGGSALRADFLALKHKATRTIKRLKQEASQVKQQKDNLLKELASRDASEDGPSQLTLEQITDSPVFKTMLGNIRRTSREEVTLLHDAIVQLGSVEPSAYNSVLVVVNSKFKAANVENPLALLPRKDA